MPRMTTLNDGLPLMSNPFGLPLCLAVLPAADGVRVAEAFQQGCYDVLLTPLDDEDAIRRLARAAAQAEHIRCSQIPPSPNNAQPVGYSPRMQETLAMIHRVANTPLPVLLQGETGTGKGVLARYLHSISLRTEAPFMAINCAALAPTLIESELFGHEKGAFTGAQGRRIGLLEAAHGGTLFLDEINSAPAEVQVRLLHFIQEKRFMRVGGVRDIEVDVRLIAASNQSLHTQVERGLFRQDLLYRLNVFPIDVPPLRERIEDIPHLGLRILQKLAPVIGKTVHACGPGVLEALQRYPWPGNVRELENVLQRTLVLAQGLRIELRDLPAEIRRPQSAAIPNHEHAHMSLHIAPGTPLCEVERRWIEHTLHACGGNRTLAAERLGIDPSTLWRKLRQQRSVLGKD